VHWAGAETGVHATGSMGGAVDAGERAAAEAAAALREARAPGEAAAALGAA